MTVTVASSAFKLHKHSVGTDYAHPLGTYALEVAGVGDATGGVVLFNLDYNAGYLYSLEGVGGLKQDTSGSDVTVTWLPQIVPGGSGFVRLSATSVAATRSVIRPESSGRRLPISVQYPGVAGVRTQVEFDVNTDAVIYRVAIWGYYWDYRATSTLTGPIRPI